jgi:hypothetical protein
MGAQKHDYVGVITCGTAHTDGVAPLHRHCTHSFDTHAAARRREPLLLKHTMAECCAAAAATKHPKLCQTPQQSAQNSIDSRRTVAKWAWKDA